MEQQGIQPKPTATTHAENHARRRFLLYAFLGMVAILVVGLIAGLIDNSVNPAHGNAFINNLGDILLVIASTSPWIVFFFLLCTAWVIFADRLFMKWNKAFCRPDEVAYGKGIIFEIVYDNNAAAAIVLIMPTLSIALALIYIAILNK